jgi:hypothetical protein
MSRNDKVKESSDLYQVLNECTDADFDGHSLFSAFTPSQRLEWLGQARADLIELKEMSKLKKSQS